MDPHYVSLVKDWVKCDNIILRNMEDVKQAKDEAKKIEERVTDAIEEKKRVEKEIVEYVHANKLETMQLKISDGVITFSKKTTQKPISQKFLKETLQKYGEENPSESIDHQKLFDYLVSNVEKKVDYSIQRTIKDTSS